MNMDKQNLYCMFENKKIKPARLIDVLESGIKTTYEIKLKTAETFGLQVEKIESLTDGFMASEQVNRSAGWPKDKRGFAGHLTLCRVRNSKAGFKLAKATEDYKNFKLGTMPADSVSVYQSQLTPEGPIYTLLGNYKLQ